MKSIDLWCLAPLLVSASVWGCAAQQEYVWFSEVQAEASAPAIAPGDRILVNVDQHPELSGEFELGTTGSYNQPLAGPLSIAGKDLDGASQLIAEKLSRYISSPVVEVTLLARHPLTITVLGEVRAPGTFTLPYETSVLTALGSAGGLSEFADEDQIFVIRAEPQAKRIRFRYSDLTTPKSGAAQFALRTGDAIVVE